VIHNGRKIRGGTAGNGFIRRGEDDLSFGLEGDAVVSVIEGNQAWAGLAGR
jgi:hypothetical protein